MTKYKIILDTDIGDDIDDAFALALILNSPEFELLGITTVFKNTFLRSKIAKHMLNLSNNKDIEVYSGIDKPLQSEIIRWHYETESLNGKIKIRHYYDDMRDVKINDKNAIDYILEEIKNNPNEITLVAIGPLTNLAAAYLKDRETFKNVKDIVLMGGQLKGDYPEWNFKVDPEAAKIIFESGIPIKMIGLDVTTKCFIDQTLVEKFSELTSPINKSAYKMMSIWINDNKRDPVFHDPLAIATMISDCCDFEKFDIKIILENPNRGKIIATKTNKGNIEAATNVRVDEFIDLLKSRFKF